ncbi:kinase-like domain-containing protein [Xylariaceae sp. FL1651]|nr:kinase-like domain-containing protein [Xylariaceae sp. FL1651]
MADTDGSSSELSPSDLELAITTIQSNPGLIGYRNLLSYASALGIKVFPKTAFNVDTWTLLGAGSYSQTWKANLLPDTGTAVAVKQPAGSFTRASSDVQSSIQHEGLTSIIQELRILANPKLRDHPNLPHVLGIFFREEERPTGVRPCVIFDLAFSDLKQYLISQRSAELLPQELTRLASNVANGIGALHSCGLVHGDVKPENILLFDRDGVLTAAVGDLGTCGTACQVSGAIPGSIRYCAPEYHAKSLHASYVNKYSRDIYNFGLLLWSILTSCNELPFPADKQFEIQHNDREALCFLLDKIPSDRLIPGFRDSIIACVQSDPTKRPSIFAASSLLDPASSLRNLDELAGAVEGILLSNPNDPKVKKLNQMPLPAHLIGKLRQEYARMSDTENAADAIRCAITLAGLYSGIIGTPIVYPWDVVAKIQWLLKAVELGSHAAITTLIVDKDVVEVLEEFGPSIYKFRHQSFNSPDIDEKALLLRLRGFSEMPDEHSANILVWLGGSLDWDILERRLQENTRVVKGDGEKVKTAEENLHHLSRFVINRHADFGIPDPDNFDLSFAAASPIDRSIYNDALEDFIILSEEQDLQLGDEAAHHLMAIAIFQGSLHIVRYLITRYAINPNDEWNEVSHLIDAITFQRGLIVEYFLEHGGIIEPAQGIKLSGLHLASRPDNLELLIILCEHIKARGQLSQVLESKPSEGPMEGWTVAYTAASCESWKSLELILQYGADPNCIINDQPGLIISAVTPRIPATSMSVLRMILKAGAQPTYGEYLWSPLYWAVGSNNVLAVFYLLLHGNAVSDAALKDAEETAETSAGEVLPVWDENGTESNDGWKNMCEAADLVLRLLRIRQERKEDWEEKLHEAIRCSSQGWRGKLWIADKNPPSYLIEVRIPD